MQRRGTARPLLPRRPLTRAVCCTWMVHLPWQHVQCPGQAGEYYHICQRACLPNDRTADVECWPYKSNILFDACLFHTPHVVKRLLYRYVFCWTWRVALVVVSVLGAERTPTPGSLCAGLGDDRLALRICVQGERQYLVVRRSCRRNHSCPVTIVVFGMLCSCRQEGNCVGDAGIVCNCRTVEQVEWQVVMPSPYGKIEP